MTQTATEQVRELRAVMEGALAKWRVWLHPLQRRLATHDGWNEPFRVTGGDEWALEEVRERGLLYVPGSRARERLWVSWAGRPSELLGATSAR